MNQKNLYLVRHGETESGGANSDRPLAKQHIHKLQALAVKLKARGIKPGVVLYSPLTRTTQTANIIAETLEAALVVCPILAEDIEPGGWNFELIELFQTYDSVMVVGHEPGLVAFLSAVTGVPPFTVIFERGTFMHLKITNVAAMTGELLEKLKAG